VTDQHMEPPGIPKTLAQLVTVAALVFVAAGCGTPPAPSSTSTTSTSTTTTTTNTTSTTTTSTTSTSTTSTTTTVPGLTVFYGRFQVTYKLVSTDPCGTVGPPGTLTLSGNPDGSNFEADVSENGGIVPYTPGQMNSDGTFSAPIVTGSQFPVRVPFHTTQSGSISGQVVGDTVTATTTVVIAPNQCSPTDPNTHTITISMTGPRG